MVRASPRRAPFDSNSPVLVLCMLEPDPSAAVLDVLVLVLRRDVRAHVRRTLPRHPGVTASARRGQRRPAAVARSGQVDVIAAGGLEPRSGTTVRPLSRAFYWTLGFAACRSAVVRAEMRTCVCGRCGGVERLAASVLGSVLCVYGVARHPCMEPTWRDVVARRVREFARTCYRILQHVRCDL